jgi:hypothetical protein
MIAVDWPKSGFSKSVTLGRFRAAVDLRRRVIISAVTSQVIK